MSHDKFTTEIHVAGVREFGPLWNVINKKVVDQFQDSVIGFQANIHHWIIVRTILWTMRMMSEIHKNQLKAIQEMLPCDLEKYNSKKN